MTLAEDVLISCVDGLEGFPEAIEATFRQAWVQTCFVHLIRASLGYVGEGLHRQVRQAIKTRRHFADEQAATKLIYLALIRADAKWQPNRPLDSRPQQVASASDTEDRTA